MKNALHNSEFFDALKKGEFEKKWQALKTPDIKPIDVFYKIKPGDKISFRSDCVHIYFAPNMHISGMVKPEFFPLDKTPT